MSFSATGRLVGGDLEMMRDPGVRPSHLCRLVPAGRVPSLLHWRDLRQRAMDGGPRLLRRWHGVALGEAQRMHLDKGTVSASKQLRRELEYSERMRGGGMGTSRNVPSLRRP